jgi:hypothetical protein
MAKVGRFVTDPKAGAYCQIVLDSGEKVLVNHDKGGFKGGTVTVSQVKWMGLASGETFLRLDLDGPAGKAALDQLTKGAPEGSARATPLGAVVERLRDCGTLSDLRARCSALSGGT